MPLAAYHVPRSLLDAVWSSSIPLDELGPGRELLARGALFWTDDATNDPRLSISLIRRAPHQSGLVLPLVLDGEVVAVFYLVWWTARRQFSDSEIRLLRAVGQQAGILLRNASLYDALEVRALRLKALTAVNQLISSSLDSREVLGAIARAAATLMEAPVVAFRVADESERVLRVGAISDEEAGRDFPLRELRYGQDVAGLVADERRVLALPGTRPSGSRCGIPASGSRPRRETGSSSRSPSSTARPPGSMAARGWGSPSRAGSPS